AAGEHAIAGYTRSHPRRRTSIRHAAVLLLSLLAGCALRAPHTDVAAPAHLSETRAERLLRTWRQDLDAYIVREGRGDPVVLSHTRALRSRDVLRPARITFGILDVEAV